MARNITHSALFYLIEAGQLARQKMTQPLLDEGLLPGDDAILLCLKRRRPMEDEELCLLTGLAPEGLGKRMERLDRSAMIVRVKSAQGSGASTRLSKRGRGFARDLVARWQELDAVLLGDLKPKQTRRFSRTLDRFVDLLLL